MKITDLPNGGCDVEMDDDAIVCGGGKRSMIPPDIRRADREGGELGLEQMDSAAL